VTVPCQSVAVWAVGTLAGQSALSALAV